MQIFSQEPLVIELPTGRTWFRIQRLIALRGSARKNGFILPPAGVLAGRFDLSDEITAYLSDSELTALYETLFRREARACTLQQLSERELVSFENRRALRLADLRGLEERYPVLQSLRYETTQDFAAQYRSMGLDGIIYASAQHPFHHCICLFDSGIGKMRRGLRVPLVQATTGRLHRQIVAAAYGSQVPIVDGAFP